MPFGRDPRRMAPARMHEGKIMKWDSKTWVFCAGKADMGKTTFEREHIKMLPKSRAVFIYDMAGDYFEFDKAKNIAVYHVRSGSLEEWEDFASMVYDIGNCTVVAAEMDNYLRKESPITPALVTMGRNRGINLMGDGKRPMSVKPDYRTRFNRLIMFRTSLPSDLEYLEDWTGQGKGSLSILKTLEQGEFIEADLDNQTLSDIRKLRL
jgi:hypothetical protein